jgi:hypothetical protein
MLIFFKLCAVVIICGNGLEDVSAHLLVRCVPLDVKYHYILKLSSLLYYVRAMQEDVNVFYVVEIK